MGKRHQPPPSITLARPSGLVAMQLAPDEIQLLEAFRSMDPIRQDHISFAASSLAQAFPRERGAPVLHLMPGAGRCDEQPPAHSTEDGQR